MICIISIIVVCRNERKFRDVSRSTCTTRKRLFKNLAEQSTEAAGETTKLIESTIDAVNKGIAIAEETEASMDQVMEEAEASTKRMVDMAQALQAEVSSVQQIDENIAHVAGIVDNNSASSQETAAVSEEQSAQAQTMVQLLHQFQI